MLKLTGIAVLVAAGIGMGSMHLNDYTVSAGAFSFSTITAMAGAMIGVLWSCGGWQHTSYLSAEAKNASRTVPLAMMLGALIVTIVYLLANVSYLMLLPAEKIIASKNVAADAVGAVWGNAGASLILLTIFISTTGTTAIYTMSAPRIYYAMAQDKIFFKKAGEIHPRYGTPLYAIIGQSLWACVLVLFWGTFENLISYVVFTDWIFFALAGASIFVFRKKNPHAERPYKTFGYPATPLFFTGVSVYIVINTLIAKPEQALAGLILLGTGVGVYYFWKRR
jgi:APA family basic amino acid/polyamine antiporter